LKLFELFAHYSYSCEAWISNTKFVIVFNIELGNACRDAGESGLKVLDTLEKGKIYTELLNTHNYSKYCPGARHVRKRSDLYRVTKYSQLL
jgi:hypothetical protein